MKVNKTLIIATLFIWCFAPSALTVEASFFDSLPFISQLKSFGQWIGGDSAGAKKTQENFVRTAPGISQVTSAVQAATGDHKAAKETQEQFATNIHDVAASLPVVGHAIGGIHVAAGDKEKGLEIIKGATSSAGALAGGLVGGLLGGPAGALAGSTLGGAAADGIITGVDSAINKEFKPFGVVDHVANFKDKQSGEHIDQLFGIALDALPGGAKSKSKSKSKLDSKLGAADDAPPHSIDKSQPPVGTVDSHLAPLSHIDELESFTLDRPWHRHSSQRDANTPMKEHASTIAAVESLNDRVASATFKTLDEVKAMSREAKLQALQKDVVHLSESARTKLQIADFMDVNRLAGRYNCYLCTLGGLTNKRIGEIAKESELANNPHKISKWENRHDALDRFTPSHVVEKLFQDTYFPGAKYFEFPDIHQYKGALEMLTQNLPKGAVYHYGFTFFYPQGGGHIVAARAWLENSGKVRTLYTDFQRNIQDQFSRYFEEVPHDYKSYSILDLGYNAGMVPGALSIWPEMPANSGSSRRRKKRSLIIEDNDVSWRSRISAIDELQVRDESFAGPCYWCVLAVLTNLRHVSHLKEGLRITLSDINGGTSVVQFVNMLKYSGYPDTRIVLADATTPQQVMDYLSAHLAPGRRSSLILAYERATMPSLVVPVILRIWRNKSGEREENVNLLITDYSASADNSNERFKHSLNQLQEAVKFHLIMPLRVTNVSLDSIDSQASHLKEDELAHGVGCQNKRRLIGYVTCWSSIPLSIKQASRFTNLIYAFVSMSSEARLQIANDTIARQRLLELIAARVALKKRGHHLALSLAIGGWSNSQHYSRVAGDPQKRAVFVAEIKSKLDEFQFDGVDLDWEYPGTGGATEGRAEDRANYVSLLRELRATLGAHKLISIAGAAGEEALRGFDIRAISEQVDWIGVMTYDFNGAWDSKWGAYVGPNAALEHAAPPNYSGKLNTNWAIKQYVCRSEASTKIILGLPFYGRYWHRTRPGKDQTNYPLFRFADPLGGSYGGDVSFREIQRNWLAPELGNQLHWDERSSTPWSFNPKTSALLTYDNVKSIQAKVNYARQHNLGGVMVWSVDQDDPMGSLASQLGSLCELSVGSGAEFKCNPLGEQRRWWTWAQNETNAGMCGRDAPLYEGTYYAHCDPDDPGFKCCGKFGYCGSGGEFCDCPECVDYSENPEKLLAQPVKPSRSRIQWHTANSPEVKPGEPKCGPEAAAINGLVPICNPDDEHKHCCSPAGFCGSGRDYCECSGCKDFSKISQHDSMQRARKPQEIRWHRGFSVAKLGEPRCGPQAPRVKDREAICDPDSSLPCCSPAGYCGSGGQFCDCKGCSDARKLV